jgi:uncharacterized membrane protein YidH (DUF202 family)
MPNLGGPELILILLVLVPFALVVFTIVDAARRPDAQFRAAGQNRTVWLVVGIAALVVPCVWLGAVYYLAAVRPKLRDAA